MGDDLATEDISSTWSVDNLADLLLSRARLTPRAKFGIAGHAIPLAKAVRTASRVARGINEAGIRPGSCAMIIGSTSTSYLLAWAAFQLAGVQTALVNPAYPVDLLHDMAKDLAPDIVVWVGLDPDSGVAPDVPAADLTDVVGGRAQVKGRPLALGPASAKLPGRLASPTDVAAYMHTSGTTGRPKFCAQSHEYFLRMGRFIADVMSLGTNDLVLAPLPMFHVNPLGYGVIGSLVAGAGVLGCDRFSASEFWSTVISEEVTASVLHVPPVAVLKRATSPEDAAGHRLRTVFGADPEFLDTFDIPQGVFGYGSTEAGGMSHAWSWRRGDLASIPEGASHLAGTGRYDIEWSLTNQGEIIVRDRAGTALFSGYRRNGLVEPAVDADDWFHTGDLGRVDEWGRLIFVERASESIRSRGEFVPIDFVEARLRQIQGLGDFAIWRRPAQIGDFDVVLYVTAEFVQADQVLAVCNELPKFMRPVEIRRVSAIPRDTGVGKVQRRRLETSQVLDSWAL